MEFLSELFKKPVVIVLIFIVAGLIAASLFIPFSNFTNLSRLPGGTGTQTAALQALPPPIQAPTLTPIGFSPSMGVSSRVVVDGTRAYIASQKFGVTLIDLGPNGRTASTLGSSNISFDGKYVALCGFNKVCVTGIRTFYGSLGVLGALSVFYVIDVSNPNIPTVVGKIEDHSDFAGLSVQGNFVFVAVGFAGVKVIDITNPTRPSVLRTVDTTGYANSTTVNGNNLYVADGSSGIIILDINKLTDSNQNADQTPVGAVETPGNAKDLTKVGDFVYVADTLFIQVIDVSTPSSPKIKGSKAVVARDVKVMGDYAYIAASGNGLVVLDVSNPEAIFEAGSLKFTTPQDGATVGVEVIKSIAYLATYGGGLAIVDIGDPTAPVLAGGSGAIQFREWFKGSKLAVSSDFGVVAGTFFSEGENRSQNGLVTFSFSGGVFQKIAEFRDPGQIYTGVALSGDYAYVTSGLAGLKVFKVKNGGSPITPSLQSTTATNGFAKTIFISGSYAYAGTSATGPTGSTAGLKIFNLSNPTSPSLIPCDNTVPGRFFCSTLAAVENIFIDGTTAYVATLTVLYIVDVSIPTQPRLIKNIPVPGTKGIKVQNGYVYVPSAGDGLNIIDIRDADSANWRIVNTLATNFAQDSSAVGVAVSGSIAYVATSGGGIVVVDISNPSSPQLLQTLLTHGTANDVSLDGDVLYVADSFAAVEAFRITGAPIVENHTLTVNKVGSGTVTGGAINCGATCSASIAQGSSVTLTATAVTGFAFSGWSGSGISCPGTGSCAITMGTSDMTVTATFTAIVGNPPVISNGLPASPLPAGTTQTIMSVSTVAAATCRYSVNANTPYTSMTNSFITTNGTAHSILLTNLNIANGASRPYYIRCQAGTDANQTDFIITISVASGPVADTTPPRILTTSPSAPLPYGTTQTPMIVTTDENARCSYSTTAGITFGSMTAFTMTGQMTHSATIASLTNGLSRLYYVKCQDIATPPNTSLESTITVVVSATDTTPPSVPQNLIATAVSPTQINLTWSASTDFNNANRVAYKLYRQIAGVNTLLNLPISNSYSLTNLTPDTLYTFVVASYDSAPSRNTSVFSAPASIATLPAIPVILSPAAFAIGDNVYALQALNARSTYSSNASIVTKEPRYAIGAILQGPSTTSDGSVWWKIDWDDTGIAGWSPESMIRRGYPTPALSVGKSGTGDGTVASSPSGIACGSCSFLFQYGASITLTASPAANSEFVSWTGCPSPSGNRCTIQNLFDDTSITATFRSTIVAPNNSSQNQNSGGVGPGSPAQPGSTSTVTSTIPAQPSSTPAGTIPPLVLSLGTPAVFVGSFTVDLRPGARSSEVKKLQQFLNTHGFPVALRGVGSRGRETNTFGLATKRALIKFQDAHLDILKRNRLKKGNGVFGPSTRRTVNEILMAGQGLPIAIPSSSVRLFQEQLNQLREQLRVLQRR